MADISEVLDAVRDAASAVLYPNGVPSGPRPMSVVNAPVRIFTGWPDASLDADLRAGICLVTIWPRGATRVISPYLDGWRDQCGPAASMTALAGDQMVTLGGNASVPQQIVAVIVDRNASYTHVVASTDTPATVAAALAQQISADRPATTSGAVLQIPDAFSIIARVVVGGSERRELRRVSEGVQVTAWCPTPALRDAIIIRLDMAFDRDRRSLPLPDGSVATLTYGGSPFDEEARAQPLHRRDLLYQVEYSMSEQRDVPAIAVPVTDQYSGDPAVIRRTIIS